MGAKASCVEAAPVGFVEALVCMRESGHPGLHYDEAERLYWAREPENVELPTHPVTGDFTVIGWFHPAGTVVDGVDEPGRVAGGGA